MPMSVEENEKNDDFVRDLNEEIIEMKPIEPTSKVEKVTVSFIKTTVRNIICSSPNWFKRTNFKKNRYAEDIYFQDYQIPATDLSGTIGVHVVGLRDPIPEPKYVIILHGAGTNRYAFSKFFPIEKLAQLGINIMIPDVRSFGDSPGVYNINEIVHDIDSCVNQMKNRFDADKISIITHELGAGMALNYLKYISNDIAKKELIDKLIMITPAEHDFDIIKSHLKARMLSKVVAVENVKEICKDILHDNMENSYSADPEKTIIIHGYKDSMIPFENVKALAEKIGCYIYRGVSDDHQSILKNNAIINTIKTQLNVQ